MLAGFRAIIPRSAEDATRLAALGATHLAPPGDLKFAAEPLPADATALAALRQAIGARPVLLAASTHPGEEALVLAAAATLRRRHPSLLTILAPRHPRRGAALAPEAPHRAQGALPDAGPVYVGDTMGELGLFYRLAGVALVGGSLVPHGGQNPLEAARLGCPMILGPHMGNFTEAVAALAAEGGALRLADAAALAPAVDDVLTNPERAAALVAGAARTAARMGGASAATLPARVAEAVLALLPKGGAVGNEGGAARREA
jgi:3-deoxy-D-manno-octulosonic-acid transferase